MDRQNGYLKAETFLFNERGLKTTVRNQKFIKKHRRNTFMEYVSSVYVRQVPELL
jgi:hypothetical protein